jgi:hypothetical protein
LHPTLIVRGVKTLAVQVNDEEDPNADEEVLIVL